MTFPPQVFVAHRSPTDQVNAMTNVNTRLDRLADRFETELRAGRSPSLEAALEGVAESAKPQVFRELLIVELQVKRLQGQQAVIAEYRKRFPNWSQEIEEAFSHGISDPLATTPQPVDTDSGQHAASGSPPSPPGDLPAEDSPSESSSGRISIAPEDLPPWPTLGDYELIRRLGSGGMGEVYLGYLRRLQTKVAIKVLPKRLTTSQSAVARFGQEMKALGRLNHPNIVRATYAGQDRGVEYLVMDYIRGIDLQQLIDLRGPLPVALAVDLIRQAAEALQYAHEQDLIHRDLKPSNVMLAENGQVKVMDFGLARLLDPGPGKASPLTDPGSVMGTADYMSPEQAAGQSNIGPASDIYSLGCTLYGLLTGRGPFQDSQHSGLIEKIQGHTKEDPPALIQLRLEVPPRVAQIVERMMAKDPAQRHASASEVAADLQAWLAESQIAVDPKPFEELFPSVGPEPPLPPPETVPRPESPQPNIGPGTRKRTIRWTAGVLLGGIGILLLAWLGYWSTTVRQKPSEPTVSKVTVDRLETNDPTPLLTGTVDDAAADVEVVVDGTVYTAAVNGNGWTAQVTKKLAEGTYDVTATASDRFGNQVTDTTGGELVCQDTSLRIEQFQVDHWGKLPNGKDTKWGELGLKTRAATEGESIQIQITLNRSAYGYIIACNPDGVVQLCVPEQEDQPPARLPKRLTFPAVDSSWRFTDGVGQQAFALVLSDEPLPPFSAWRAEKAALPWRPTTSSDGKVWEFDGDQLTEFEGGKRGRPEKLDRGSSLGALCLRLRNDETFDAMRVFAFSVLPQESAN